MAAYVVILDGRWVNGVEWDGVEPWAPPDGAIAVPMAEGEVDWDGGWTYEGVRYTQEYGAFPAANEISVDG